MRAVRFSKKNILYTAIVCIMLLIACGSALAASPAGAVKKANQLYEKGKYDEALEEYNKALETKPNSDIINYDIGAARYKKKEYEKSSDAFTKALTTQDPILESKSNYNIANTNYKKGAKTEQGNSAGAIASYKTALDYYRRAIELDEKDLDAKFNYEFVEKKIKELEAQGGQDKGEKKKDKQKQNQKQDQSQNKQGGGKGEQNEEKQEKIQNQQNQKEEQNKQEEQKQEQEKQEQEKKEQQKKEQQQKEEEQKKQEQKKQQEEKSQEPKEKEDNDIIDIDQLREQARQELEEEKSGSAKASSDKQNKPKQDKQGGSGQQGEPKEMSEDEANLLLEGNRQEEQMYGALEARRKHADYDENYKDW